jgi:hypothetical protein
MGRIVKDATETASSTLQHCGNRKGGVCGPALSRSKQHENNLHHSLHAAIPNQSYQSTSKKQQGGWFRHRSDFRIGGDQHRRSVNDIIESGTGEDRNRDVLRNPRFQEPCHHFMGTRVLVGIHRDADCRGGRTRLMRYVHLDLIAAKSRDGAVAIGHEGRTRFDQIHKLVGNGSTAKTCFRGGEGEVDRFGDRFPPPRRWSSIGAHRQR